MDSRVRIACLTLLAHSAAACLPIGRPWPSSEPIARASDTRWPTLSVELRWIDADGESYSPGTDHAPSERVLRTLRTSDLFRIVEPAPGAAEWSMMIEVEERGERLRTSLALADAQGALLFRGERVGERSFGDPVSDFVRGLLVEARERGLFVERVP